MSVGVYIDIVYIMPTTGGMYIGWSLHWYCIYHANNWGHMCNLLGVFGSFGPRVGGFMSIGLHIDIVYFYTFYILRLLHTYKYCKFCIFCIFYILYILHILYSMYISCQQLDVG